jgi:hypothetical protein
LRTAAKRWNLVGHRFAWQPMGDGDKVYDEPSEVKATDGKIEVEGPDEVHVSLTPEAAEETSDRLSTESVMARGQRRLRNFPHRSKP